MLSHVAPLPLAYTGGSGFGSDGFSASFDPRVVTAAIQTTMISASITAYSTCVGPSSRFKKSVKLRTSGDFGCLPDSSGGPVVVTSFSPAMFITPFRWRVWRYRTNPLGTPQQPCRHQGSIIPAKYYCFINKITFLL